MVTPTLTPCGGDCHRKVMRDLYQALMGTAAATDPRLPEWRARSLLADSTTCAVYARCPKGTAYAEEAEQCS